MWASQSGKSHWLPPRRDEDDDDNNNRRKRRESKPRDSTKEDPQKDKSGSRKSQTRGSKSASSRRNTVTRKSTSECEKRDDKKKDKPRKDPDNATKLNLLISDFFVMFESSPNPGEVFNPDSQEFRYATQWLNKLKNMTCSTVLEGRTRNAYMSALSMSLNGKRLHRIFNQEPPEELEWVDFSDNAASTSAQAATRMLPQFISTAQTPQRSFDLFGSTQLNGLIERTMGWLNLQYEKPRQTRDGQQQFMAEETQDAKAEEPQDAMAEEPHCSKEKPHRYRKPPQELQMQSQPEERPQLEAQPEPQGLQETISDTATFPPPTHLLQEWGSFYKTTRVVTQILEGKKFCTTGGGASGSRGVQFADLGTDFIETSSDTEIPGPSILKQNCVPEETPDAPVYFNSSPYFDDEIWYKSPLETYIMEHPEQEDHWFNGPNQTDPGCSGSRQQDPGCSGPIQTDPWWSRSSWKDYGCSGSRQQDPGCSGSNWKDPGCSGSRQQDPGCSGPSQTGPWWSGSSWKDDGCSGSNWKDPGCSRSRQQDPGCSGSNWKDPGCSGSRQQDPGCSGSSRKDPGCSAPIQKDPRCSGSGQTDPRCSGPSQKEQQIEPRNTQYTHHSGWTPEPSEAEYGSEDSERPEMTSRHSHMTFLMKCIRRELSGEAAQGASAYLEGEIVRYQLIASKYRSNDPEYKANMLERDAHAQRKFLLISMQEDLTKFLSN